MHWLTTLLLLAVLVAIGAALGLPWRGQVLFLSLLFLPATLVWRVRARWADERARGRAPSWRRALLESRAGRSALRRGIVVALACSLAYAFVRHQYDLYGEEASRRQEAIERATDTVVETQKLEQRLPELLAVIRELERQFCPDLVTHLREDAAVGNHLSYDCGLRRRARDTGRTTWLWYLERKLEELNAELDQQCLEQRRLKPILDERALLRLLRRSEPRSPPHSGSNP